MITALINQVGAEGWATIAVLFAFLWVLSEVHRAHEARQHIRGIRRWCRNEAEK